MSLRLGLHNLGVLRVPSMVGQPAEAVSPLWPFHMTKRGGWPYAHAPNVPFTLNRQSPQGRGLAAWWPTLGSQGQNTLRDYARGNHATKTGTTTWSAEARMGMGITYPGTDTDYYNTPYYHASDVATLAYWVEFAVANDDGDLTGHHDGANHRFYVGRSGDERMWIGFGDSNLATLGAVGFLRDTNLHHLCMSGDGSAARAYFDGVYLGQMAYSWAGTSTDPFHIGDLANSASNNIDGTIYDLRIYSRALSADEVWALYNPATRWELYAPLALLH